jgi:tetratricopeptide (TPR) repeat protein
MTQAYDSTEPVRQAERALAAARAAGDRPAEAVALTDLGVALTRGGEPRRAADVLIEARALARTLGDVGRERDAVGNLAWAVLTLGDAARGLGLLEEALTMARAAGDRVDEKLTLFRLGNTWAALHDPYKAAGYYNGALALARSMGDWQHEAEILWSVGIQAAEAGERGPAIARAREAVEILSRRGHAHARWFADNLGQFESGGAGLAPAGELLGVPAAPGPAPVGPGILRLALSAAKAVVNYVGSGLATVSPATRQRRLDVCATCEFHTGVRCRVCGCFTAVKTWLPHEACPLDRWPAQR